MIKQGKYASASAVQLWDVDRTWSLVGVFLVVVVFCLIDLLSYYFNDIFSHFYIQPTYTL